MATLFPFPNSSQDYELSYWAEVPGGIVLVPMVSKLETTAYLALLFPSKTKLYQISINVPDFLRIGQRIF